MSLTFTIENHDDDNGGALTDADSTPTIGIIRTDTSAVVVADGTAMTRDSLGVYSYTIASPSVGVTYRATWVMITDGETITDSFDQTAGAGDASWHYADFEAIEDILGTSDLTIIADPDNDGTVNYDLVQRAGEHADAMMDAKFAAAGFTVPLAGTTAADDLILRDINAKLTIAQLNRSRALVVVTRGNTTQVAGVDRVMMTWEREAWSMLSSIVHGDVGITADRTDAVASAPVPAFTTYFVRPTIWY